MNPPALAHATPPRISDFEHDLLEGLSQPVRAISPKYFYDARGSALFDEICELPEYYPTRTELGILAAHAPEMAARIGADADLVEFGAGSLNKVGQLLAALQARNAMPRYVPIDISGEHLGAAVQNLRARLPGLDVTPVVADYTRAFTLPAQHAGRRRIGFFPGSTLGNFAPGEALAFLRQAARLLRGGSLLIGVDLVKDPALLHAAYNDAQGVTAAFNLNLLRRANSELGTDFDLDGYAHHALYHPGLRRIEMHLVSRRAQTVTVAGQRFDFDEGESLHTESSHKFTVHGLRALASQAGFRPGPVWTDPDRRFSVHWLDAPAAMLHH